MKYLTLCITFSTSLAVTAQVFGNEDINTAPVPDYMRPIKGWSTWDSFRCSVNETMILESIDVMEKSGLPAAGYTYMLLDDCWTACLKYKDGPGINILICFMKFAFI